MALLAKGTFTFSFGPSGKGEGPLEQQRPFERTPVESRDAGIP
jgi:hypothetical protein